jgi:hypothetical protein
MELCSHLLCVTHSFCNGYNEYWIYHLGCVYPPASEILCSTSTSSYIAFSYGKIMWFMILFLSKVHCLSS